MDDEASPGPVPRTVSHRWGARILAVAFLAGSLFLLLAGTAAAVEVGDPVLEEATEVVDGVTDVVADTVEPIVDEVTDTVEPVVDEVVDTVEPIVDEVTDTVEPVVNEVVDTVEPIVDDVTDTVSDTVDPVVDIVDPVVDETTEVIGDVTDPVVDGGPSTDDGSTDTPPVPSTDGTTTPGGISFLFAGARSSSDGAFDNRFVATFSATNVSAPGGLLTFGVPLDRPRVPSTSSVPTSVPLGGLDVGGALTALGLFAFLSLSVRLFLPRIRSTHAPGVVEWRSASLALSVERPG
jgi:hypothetical protein